ncbi:hypothetical protein ACHRV5_10640 [Flavobacterium sp. FlaQc-52]|jgi:hypothetical protein|uniref:hypothetical protein n=1 Tax=Flavobacterium sp. FlaQc-52 TaxID=3374185 RepID=UPI003756DE2E
MTTTTIAILRDGTPVRISMFEKPIFDLDGFLVQFTRPGTNPELYRYHQHAEFKREDRKKPDLAGYYNEDLFLKYIQNIQPTVTVESLVKHDFERDLATENEEITVSTVDFDAPYDYFYDLKNYTFNLQLSADKKNVANYRKIIRQDQRIVDYKINTDGYNAVIVPKNEAALPSGKFYSKNFGSFANTLNISNVQKSKLKKVMSLIIFKIKEINRDIIPILASRTHFFDKENDVANGIIDYNDNTTSKGFTDLEKLLFDLKRGWGYYYDTPLEGYPRPLRDDFDSLFYMSSPFEDYQTYLSSLTNFYTKCYTTKGLDYYPSNKKFQYLLEILSPSALRVLPFNYITNAIKGLVKRKLEQEDQRFLVRLVLSVTTSHANEFLDFLLEKENGVQTNFQAIYGSLTDARLERYTFVNWFVDEQTNRKYFAFAIFELWKVSKYNLDYIRPGIVIPDTFPNFKGVDPNNYFFINPNEYNEKNWLTFVPSVTEFTVTTEQYFKSTLVDKKINIDKISKLDINFEHGGFHNNTNVFFGSFHLYQQISFSGFETNLDLMLPKTATVPAFLFHFIDEYDSLADFDAGVSLAIDLTTDALLIYFTGGISVLRDLQYLKYSTKIGRALQGGLSGVEAVEVWRGLEAGSEAFTITTGGLAQINHYLITRENNPEKKKILEKSQTVILILMILGASSSFTARAKGVQEADETLRLINGLPANTPHNIPQPMIDVLTTLSGQKAVTLSLFGNKLNNVELAGAINKIAPKYNMFFTDAQRLAFWKDFQHIDDPAFWKLLNSGKGADNLLNGKYIDNWISLNERGLIEAKFTDYICVQKRTDTLIKYIDEASTNLPISKLSYEKRLVFLDTFGDANSFAKFTENPQLINKWIKFYDDLVLRPSFTFLGKDKQLLWLEHYPNLSTNLINHIKTKPNTFKNWSELSEIDKLILKNIPEEWIPSVYQYQDFCFIKKLSPIEIPSFTRIFPKEKNGYLQVEFRYTENGYKWEVRAHTEIPNSPGVGNGQVWVIKREIISDGTFAPYQEFLSGDDWIRGYIWYDLISKQKSGIITDGEKLILKNGHFKAK